MVKRFPLFLLFVLAAACSLQTRKEQADLRELFRRKQTSEALALLEKSQIKKEEKNLLLYLLQKGKLLYAQKDFKQAGQTFVEAAELMDRLYTKSVSEAALSGVANNNSQTYYGTPLERSLLFYYQALSFLNVYQQGFVLEGGKVEERQKTAPIKVKKDLSDSERKSYLRRARASILAWDTFYKELQRSSRESTSFDRDLFAKVLGAKIHEFVGGRSDEQIALQLYKDAYDILLKTGPAFKSYNPKFEPFAKALRGGASDIKETFETSQSFKGIQEFLQYKILKLTKKRQAWNFKKLEKKLNPSKETLDKLKEKNNVTVLVESSLIAPLEGETFSYNLRSAMDKVENPAAKAFIAGVGLPVLTYFAMGPLGLGAVSSTHNSRFYVRHGAGELMTSEAGIEFEMPVIREPAAAGAWQLVAVQKSGKEEKEAARKDLALAGPISDLAYQMNLESASLSFGKRGARIAMKHVLAIVAAYKTYQAMQKSSGEVFAKPAAFAQYLMSSKAIKATEKADTRQWSTLPSEVFLTELSLKPGLYELHIVDPKNPASRISLGQALVKSKDQDFFSYILP